MIFRRSLFLTFAMGICITIGFIGGYFVKERSNSQSNEYVLLDEAFGILRDHGLKPIPEESQLEYGMIRGMLQSYDDPFTIFLEPAQHELESNTLHGSYGGIGVRLVRDEQGDVVLFPYLESSAIQAGLQDGDRLLAVDTLTIEENTSMDAVEAALRGPVGSFVRVQISRAPSNQQQIYKIKRVEFAIPSVAWHLDPDHPQVGVLGINMIAASTAIEVERAINDLSRQNATLYVIDLRNNYGGLLSAGVDIARLFLKGGVVMEHQYRDKEVEVFRVEREGPFFDLPIVVLVNANTASAAEIVAGAFKAQKRAQIIGTPTYGKDTIQLVFELKDGSSMHVTAAKWWIPGLVPPIGEGGLHPDISLTQPLDENQGDSAMKAAAEILIGEP